jgi:hypothetical protein
MPLHRPAGPPIAGGLRFAPHAIMNVRHGPARLKGGFAVADDRASSTLDPHRTAPKGLAIGASRRYARSD